LTTGAIPYRDAVFDMEFDFVSHVLVIRHSGGDQKSGAVSGQNRSPSFTQRRFSGARQSRHRIAYHRHAQRGRTRYSPFRLRTISTPNTIPMRRGAFWQQLVQAHRVMDQLPRGVRRKKPVRSNCFWGALDLGLHTIFRSARTAASGRSHPKLPGLGHD